MGGVWDGRVCLTVIRRFCASWNESMRIRCFTKPSCPRRHGKHRRRTRKIRLRGNPTEEGIAAEDVADSKETILAVEGDVVVVEVVAWKEEGQRRIALEANSDPMHNNMGFIAFIAASLALILVQMA